MEESVYRFGEFSISPAERRLFKGSESVVLPPQAFDALYLLIRRPGGLVAKSEFMKALWPGVHVSEANLTNIVVQLRKVFGREAIETVSKFGYRFTVPVTGEPGIRQGMYEIFIRGRDLMTERSLDSIARARDLFTICVADDPQFAMGWAWLGRASRLMEKFRGAPASATSVAEAAFRRAFAIDPDLACAHNFYTQLQVDVGRGAAAMTRLATQVRKHGEDPETLTGLVQVLRCCGLLEESVAAHERALAIDPTTKTSVAHTAFLRGDYASVFETYLSKGYYLDAAAWAALGQVERAAKLLRTRLEQADLGPLMSGMMRSLLDVLEGHGESAVALADKAEGTLEPEGAFYFARHCGMVGDAASAVALVRRARLGGFWASWTLERDVAFAAVREDLEFQAEVQEAKVLEERALHSLKSALGYTFTDRR